MSLNCKVLYFLLVLSFLLFFLGVSIVENHTHAQCLPCYKSSTGINEGKPVSGENATIIYGNKTVVYFYIPGCMACSATENYLMNLQEEFPYIEIIKENMARREKQELREFYDSFYKIPKEDRGAVPAVFINNKAFIGRSIIEKNLKAFLQEETNELLTERNEIVLNSWPKVC